MGGNAFKDDNGDPRNVRLDKSQYYNAVMNDILPVIRAKVHYETRVEMVRHVRNKKTFGDVDILVENIHEPKNRLDENLIKLYLGNYFMKCNIQDVVKNGNVWSILWDSFQVDLIFVRSEWFDFARNYFAWNDFGNLIGRVTRPAGYKFGFDGLFWIYKRPDNGEKFREVLATRSFGEALEFFDYDYERYLQGFNSIEEMYEYVVTSKYFNPEFFALETRANKDRVRDRKRVVYNGFVEWCKGREFPEPATLTKEHWAIKGETWWLGLQNRNWQVGLEYGRQKMFKMKFSAKEVMAITGLTDRALGEFIAYMKDNGLVDYTQRATADEVTEFIKKSAAAYGLTTCKHDSTL